MPDIREALTETLEKFSAIEPYIDRHTSKVCPSCPKVCCINRHSYYDETDLLFIRALGLDNAGNESGGPDEEPCRFLQEHGCLLPRYRRPFRCTWYFCDRLLESMHEDIPSEYRAFIKAFERLQLARRKIIGGG